MKVFPRVLQEAPLRYQLLHLQQIQEQQPDDLSSIKHLVNSPTQEGDQNFISRILSMMKLISPNILLVRKTTHGQSRTFIQ